MDLLPIPLLADHSGLPPTYIQICGFDPATKACCTNGCCANKVFPRGLNIYPGIPHSFHVSAPTMMATKKWEADLRAGLKWILAQEL
ncbi:hypothetical protein B0H14DRAFT_3441390 [Mycena olivaceomarginata]|nr:hypothetical protein B0H14DRAFT_3441390 [Mycena olivaceomarginata]